MKNRFVFLELTCSALFWGLTFNLAKVTVNYVAPMTAASLRFLLAATLMVAVVALMRLDWVKATRLNLLAFFAMAIFGVVGFNLFFFIGLSYTSPTNGALIMATNPLVTALLAALFLREPISANHKIGTMVSFTGVAMLILLGTGNRLVDVNRGDLCIIGGNISMALYSVLQRRYVRESTPLMTTAVTTVLGAIILWFVAREIEPAAPIIGLPWFVYAAIFFMGACGSVLAYIFWNRGIRAIGVADTVIFFHLVPVFTVLLSFLIGQRVTVLQIGAGLVVSVGVMISTGALKRLVGLLGRSVPEKSAIAGSSIAESAGAQNIAIQNEGE